MSDDLKVDWSKPLVVYHQDGRAMPVELYAGEAQPDGEGDYEIIPPREVPTAYFREDGTPSPNGGGLGCGWRIRNVAEGTQDPTPDVVTLTADQAAMLRKVLTAIGGCSMLIHNDITSQIRMVPESLVQEACAIVAPLPEPVDDLEQDFCAECHCAGDFPPKTYVVTLDGFKRALTRALERDSREG